MHRPAWLTGQARRLGRYCVGPSLGKGGMGEVFEAWDTLLGRRVALKLLSSWSATAALRLMQEAQLQARVDHPNICRVLDVDTTAEPPYIAMQLVDGPTLGDAGLDHREAATVLQRVAEAVHAAHRMGLIHRDLKPTNILLERTERGTWVPYVCDFGLAKDLHADSLTQSRASMGTPAFMAPEQMFQNGARVGPATDIYGLGASLYDTLTGQPPIPQLDGRPRPGRVTFPRPRELDPLIPRALEQILLRCLEWNPTDRYPSAAGLAEDLRRFLDGEPLQPRAGGLRGQVQWQFRRHPWAFAGLGLALTLALGATFTYSWSRREAARQTLVAERFTGAIKDLQYQMRIERMLPAHDLRPGFTRVRERMQDIRAAMKELGPTARGSGAFALGWGHLLLREPGEALTAFQTAWDQGYQTPEVATAWAQAHCDAFIEELPTARQQGPKAIQALKTRHLPSAQALLSNAPGQVEPSQLLVLAQLETLDGRPEAALVLARQVAATNPTLYEARIWEAAALTELGFDQQLAGRYAQAKARYLEADAALRRAQGVGRSDEMALKIELNRRLAWVAVQGDAGGISTEDFESIEDLADRLLALNPEWLPAVADKLTALWRRGDFELGRGRDPSPFLERGLAVLAAARTLPNASALLQRDRENLCRALGEWQYERGQDPRPVIAMGLEGSAPDEYAVDLLVLRARWSLAHGLDPRPDLDLALEGVAHPTFQNPDEYGLALRRVMIGRWRVAWSLLQRQDPQADLDQVLAAGLRGLATNPRSSDLLMESSACLELAYQATVLRGHRTATPLLQSLQQARLAESLSHSAASARQLTSVELRLTEHALATGRTGEAWLRLAGGHLAEARRNHPTHPELTTLQERLSNLRRTMGVRPREAAPSAAAAPAPPPPG